jgi:hypothetical protein
MSGERVLDREVVEAELHLHLAKKRLVRLEEPNPDERVRAHDDVADVVQRNIADPPAV